MKLLNCSKCLCIVEEKAEPLDTMEEIDEEDEDTLDANDTDSEPPDKDSVSY